METRTLVIIGFLLILLSSGLYFFINITNLMGSLTFFKQNKAFNDEKKNELKQIDKKVSNELDTYNRPKIELTKIKNIIESDYTKSKSIIASGYNKSKNSIEENNDTTNSQSRKEVFLVDNNIFSKSDASKVCKGLFNGTIANKEQLNENYNNGANWCNYGWDNDGEAYYPLQSDTNNSACEGSKGLNGGKMPTDASIKLGALCYGVKPEDGKYSSLTKVYQDSAFSEGDLQLLDNYRKKLTNGGIKITPFNDKAWSRWSYKNDTLTINNKKVITNKTESSNNPQALETNKCKIQAII